ncbi:hypothetical protein KC909_01515 [Candidatus Dojkabacteria bacterium]|uniref:Uncharacterized protein n=1 Tax=Candidatus Dojkabacteria bacterium TaxID=2099670 RepID=A0A955L4Z6_9BACT|nr:hypothetical protein [Candidatus Dojkabacteria bacterium]
MQDNSTTNQGAPFAQEANTVDTPVQAPLGSSTMPNPVNVSTAKKSNMSMMLILFLLVLVLILGGIVGYLLLSSDEPEEMNTDDPEVETTIQPTEVEEIAEVNNTDQDLVSDDEDVVGLPNNWVEFETTVSWCPSNPSTATLRGFVPLGTIIEDLDDETCNLPEYYIFFNSESFDVRYFPSTEAQHFSYVDSRELATEYLGLVYRVMNTDGTYIYTDDYQANNKCQSVFGEEEPPCGTGTLVSGSMACIPKGDDGESLCDAFIANLSIEKN